MNFFVRAGIVVKIPPKAGDPETIPEQTLTR